MKWLFQNYISFYISEGNGRKVMDTGNIFLLKSEKN